MGKKVKTLITTLALTMFISGNVLNVPLVRAENILGKDELINITRKKALEKELSLTKTNDVSKEEVNNVDMKNYAKKHNNKIRVTIETYDGIFNNRKSVEKKVEKDVHAKVKHEFKNLINGFSTEINQKDLEKIKKIPGVKKIRPVRMYKPTMNYAKELCEVTNVWKECNYKGEGIVISIIDTGIDYTHKDMKLTNPLRAKIKKGDIKPTYPGKFFTNKIPYGYNFADKNQDVVDRTSSLHGIHVAGIAGANGDTKDITENKAIKGVAPEAQLLAMKVFSNNPEKGAEGAFSDDIVAAIEDSVEKGADIINLSLGADGGFVDENDPEQIAIKKATEKGVIVVAAAGNASFSSKKEDGSKVKDVVDTELLDNPGLGKESIQVAASENIKDIKNVIEYCKGGQDYKIPYISSEINPIKIFKPQQEVELIDCGYGRKYKEDKDNIEADDFKEKDLKGKIALIKRGKNHFEQKAKNAQREGAVGVIIYNKDSDEEYVPMLLSDKITIPCVFTTNFYGKELTNLAKENIKIKFTDEIVVLDNLKGEKMAEFSSWGPTPNLDFKPEITAPGGKIFSTINNNKYTTYSGTSMATPYISGSVALIKQALKNDNVNIKDSELSRYIKNNMINTAKVLLDGTIPYSPRCQGGGLVQVDKAIKNRVLITNDEDQNSAVSLREISRIKRFNLTLTNYGDKDTKYTINGNSVYTEQKDKPCEQKIEGAKLSFSRKEVTLKAHSTANIKVKLTIPYKFKKNNFVEGFISFDSKVKGVPSLSVPYIGFYGNWGEPQNIDRPIWENHRFKGSGIASNLFFFNTLIGKTKDDKSEKIVIDPSEIAFSPDGDGFYDHAIPNLCIFRNLKELKVDILDKNKKFLKTCGYKNNVHKSSECSEKGREMLVSLAWDGKIYDKKTGKNIIAPDGQYYMRVTSKAVAKNAKLQSFDMPVKVDATKPDVSIISSDHTDTEKYTLKWTASDKGVGLKKPDKDKIISEPEVYIDGVEVENPNFKEKDRVFSCDLDLEKGTRIISLIVNDNILNTQVIQKEIAVGKKPEGIKDVLLNYNEGSVITNEYMDGDKYLFGGLVSVRVDKVTVNDVEAELNREEKWFSAKVDLKEGPNTLKVKAYNKEGEILFNKKVNIIAHITPPKMDLLTEEKIILSEEKNIYGVINTNKNKLKIKGKVDKKEVEKVSLNYDDITLNDDGTFEKYVELSQGINQVEIVAKTSIGTVNRKNIKVIADYKEEKLKLKLENYDITKNKYELLEPNSFFGAGGSSELKIKVTTNKAIRKIKLNKEDMHEENIMEYTKSIFLKQGINKIMLYVEDNDGNIAADYAVFVYYDSEKPVIRLSSPNIINGKIYTNKNFITLKGDVADNTLGYKFSINGEQILNIEQNADFGLEKSRRSFTKRIKVKNGDFIQLYAKDVCLNETSQVYEVVVGK
ncbi:S8 family serine peptidase [Hathewaya limosa]|uniref:Lactocepin n=1 Tax=Hathewaya limosa TaxID=1536 RepID=A0ABU0JTV4_HATLI|nr:S8 family serine peptidase [Hathewaya limosa]MDQ0480529.1 lactocepin [Hathewaya limosa]